MRVKELKVAHIIEPACSAARCASRGRVEPQALALSDPLTRIDGLLNAITIHTDTPASVTVIGPGAGRFQAGQGMLADLITIAKGV